MNEISQYDETILSKWPFKYLEKHELNQIKSYCELVTFQENNLLFEQGKRGKGMLILLEGKAFVVGKGLSGSMTIDTLEEGNFYGEVCLLNKNPCPATVVAKEKTTCILLSSIYFEMLSLVFPEIKYKITKAILESVLVRIEQIRVKITQTMNEKLVQSLTLVHHLNQNLIFHKKTSFSEARINPDDLKKSSFFRNFCVEELDFLLKEVDIIKTSKQYTLLESNHRSSDLFFVIRGAVQIRILKEGKSAKVAVLSPISFFSHTANMVLYYNHFIYNTCERSIIFILSKEKTLFIQKNYPSLWYRLFNMICLHFISLEIFSDKLLLRLNSERYNR